MLENAGKIDAAGLNVYASMINDSSHNLLQLIENLLQWARSQTDDVLKIYISQAETKGITLNNEIPDNTLVFADSELPAIIIRDLISNGIKYTRKGIRVCVVQPDNPMGAFCHSKSDF